MTDLNFFPKRSERDCFLIRSFPLAPSHIFRRFVPKSKSRNERKYAIASGRLSVGSALTKIPQEQQTNGAPLGLHLLSFFLVDESPRRHLEIFKHLKTPVINVESSRSRTDRFSFCLSFFPHATRIRK